MQSLTAHPLSAITFFALAASFLLAGCLTAERKVITLQVNPDGTGSGTIVFYNLKSMQEDESDRALTDYSRLIDTWLHGNEFERANPALYNVQKRLFANKEQLNGEISFDFYHYGDIGLYRHNDVGPWMYYAYLNTSEIEQFDTTNGQFGGDYMPIIFWPEKTTTFEIVNKFETEGRPEQSLFPLYDRIGVQKKN